MFCEHCVFPALEYLLQSDDRINVHETKRKLADQWRARCVDIYDASGHPIHGRTLLANAIRQPIEVEVDFRVSLHAPGFPSSADIDERAQDSDLDALDDSHADNDESGVGGDAVIRERLLRELARKERQGSFLWAGFVINDLLCGYGLDRRAAQVFFDRAVDDGCLILKKKRNPNNPEYPVTAVQLNMNHPEVQRTLRADQSSQQYLPIPIRGGPASATLVRNRR